MSSEPQHQTTHGGKQRVLILIAAITAVGLVAPAPAAARHRSDTFKGSCEIPAVVRFDPPLTGSTQQVHTVARGKGPCTGTWTTSNGRRYTLNAATVVYQAEANGQQSCSGSEGTRGPGYLRYRKRMISFTFSEERVGVYTPIRLEGRGGGAFEGRADPSEDQDPAELFQKCASSGLDRARVVIRGSTVPSITG